MKENGRMGQIRCWRWLNGRDGFALPDKKMNFIHFFYRGGQFVSYFP